jgi:hypothetical protein
MARDFGEEIRILITLQEDVRKGLSGAEKAFNDYFKKVATSASLADGVNDQQDAARLKAHEARLKALKTEQAQMQRVQTEMRRIQFVGRGFVEISQTIAIASGAAMAVMVKAAADYIKNAKASTDTTRSWKIETSSLAQSYSRIGSTIATQALPYLQKAADLAEGMASFLEKHPRLAGGALTATGVVLAVSTLALIASKGFRIYADYQYIIATSNELKAAAAYQKATLEFDAGVASFAESVAAFVGATTVNKAAAAAWGGVVVSRVAKGLLSGPTQPLLTGAAIGSMPLLTGPVATGIPLLIAKLGGLGPVIGTILPPLGLLLAALGILGFELNEVKKQNIDLGKTTKQLAVSGLAGLGGMFAAIFGAIKMGYPDMKKGQEVFEGLMVSLGRLFGVVDKPVNFGAYVQDFATKNLEMWRSYQKEITDATTQYAKQRAQIEQDYEKQRTDIVRQYAEQRAQAEEDYNISLSRAYRDFQQGENQTERDYYEGRLKAARDYSQKLLEMEEDHQIEMRRMLEDHELTQQQLLESRDGMAMIREDQRYELERQRKEEDYAKEVARYSEETALRLRENEKQFAKERAQRLAAFQQRMADQATDYALQAQRAKEAQEERLAALRDEHDNKLAEIDASYKEQLKTLEKAFRERLIALDQAILGDLKTVQDGIQIEIDAFSDYIMRVANSVADALNGSAIKKAVGGYASYGKYILGEQGTEFILTSSTTKALEQSMGGRLTQGAVLSGGRGGYVDNRTFYFNDVTEETRAAIRRDMFKVAQNVFAEGMG